VRSSQYAIVDGTVDPGSVDLSSEQRASIVRVLLNSEARFDLCTGMFIAQDWVLTARHCQSAAGFVVLGSDSTAPLATGAVERAWSHPELDLLLLHVPRLSPAVPFEPLSLRSAPLDQSWQGRSVELAGFGETDTGEVGRLRFVTEPITSVGDVSVIVDGMGRSGACLGDSGGPLLAVGADAAIEVIGVLNAGSASCKGRDRYVRIDVAMPWLTEIVTSFADPCDGT
jgi:hypothetical protein